MKDLADKYGKTAAQIFFAFVRSQGLMFLTGTTSRKHMTEDLDVVNIQLNATEIGRIAELL